MRILAYGLLIFLGGLFLGRAITAYQLDKIHCDEIDRLNAKHETEREKLKTELRQLKMRRYMTTSSPGVSPVRDYFDRLERENTPSPVHIKPMYKVDDDFLHQTETLYSDMWTKIRNEVLEKGYTVGVDCEIVYASPFMAPDGSMRYGAAVVPKMCMSE